MKKEEDNKGIFDRNIVCSSKKRAELDETAHLKKYIMWENKSNICWLDASMALIAFNKVLKRASQVSPNSKINSIIQSYAEVVSILNVEEKSVGSLQSVDRAKSRLNCVQESTLQYLRPILKYKPGDPDSAFCSLYNLLKENAVMKDMLEVTWISVKTCTSCDKTTESTKNKPIITLSKVDTFDPKNPTVIYYCNCDRSEQRIKFVFVDLPPCLIFHFENGAGHKKPPLDYATHGRHYYLTAIMTLEKGQESNVNHFITWIRDPLVDKWLDCNDLNPDIVYFTPNFPDIKFEDVSFYVYESFDDLGTIRDCIKRSVKSSEEEIVVIDISEESDNRSSSNAGTDQVLSAESQVAISPSAIDSSKSLNKTLAGDEEHISDKEVIKTDSAQSSKSHLNEIKDSENDKNSAKPMRKMPQDEDTEHNIQNEGKKVVGFQNLRLSYDESVTDASEKVIQNDFDDKNKFEACELNNQVNSCPDQKQTNDEDLVLPCEEIKLKNAVVVLQKPKSKEVKEDKQNKASLPIKEFHFSELRKSPKDITKADIAESGTSYVKLSFRRKKYPPATFSMQNSVKKDNKVDLDETKTVNVRKSPRCVKGTKNLKRNRDEDFPMPEKRPRKNQKFRQTLVGLQSNAIEEDGNTVPEKRPSKNQKLEKTPKDLHSNAREEDTSHFMFNKDYRMLLQDKSKINTAKKKIKPKNRLPGISSTDFEGPEEHSQVFTSQETSSTNPSATENSPENEDEIKILKGFESLWADHTPGCRCEDATLEETIDTVVDYTFAYICKLGQALKKANLKSDNPP